MGSDSGSDSDSAKVKEEEKQKVAEEERQKKEYLDKLSKATGWERFSLGTKHGYKNWTGKQQKQSPGDYDKVLQRTLRKDDFAAGGVYGEDAADAQTSKDDQSERRSARQKAATSNTPAGAGRAVGALTDNVGPLGLNASPDVAKTQQTLDDDMNTPNTAKSGDQAKPDKQTGPDLLREESRSPLSHAPATPGVVDTDQQMASIRERKTAQTKAQQAEAKRQNALDYEAAAWGTQRDLTKPAASVVQGPMGPLTDPMTGDPIRATSMKTVNETAPTRIVENRADEFLGLTSTGTPISESPYKDLQERGKALRADWAAANVGEQPTSWHEQQANPQLSDEVTAMNARMADALAKTTDFSTAKGLIKDALKTGSAQAQLEVNDLIRQLEDRKPGHGQKLAEEVGVTSAQNNTEQRQDQKAANVGDQQKLGNKEIEHKENYKRSSKLSDLTGQYNDGLVGAGPENYSGINWNDKVDDSAHLRGGFLADSTTFHVNGPIRIEPVSNTVGYERSYIRVDWFEVDETGKPKAEYRNQDKNPKEYSVGGGLNIGPGYLDFAPPYPDHNPHGYHVTITSPPQDVTHGNPAGVRVNIYTQEGDKTATQLK